MARDYQRERELAIRRGETGNGSQSGDAKRHRARRQVEKVRTILSGQEVDHKKPIKSGGGNSMSNLRVRSVSANRSAGGKSGNAKEKGKRKS